MERAARGRRLPKPLLRFRALLSLHRSKNQYFPFIILIVILLNFSSYFPFDSRPPPLSTSILDAGPPFPTRYAPIATANVSDVAHFYHAVIVCHYATLCCHETIASSLRSLLQQSLPPAAITVLHSCLSPEATNRLSRAVADVASLVNLPRARPRIRSCATPPGADRSYDFCVLRSLHNQRTMPLTVLVTDRHILESTALEKAWLSLALRPNVSALTSLAFSENSLRLVAQRSDPLAVSVRLPNLNQSLSQPFSATPLFLRAASLGDVPHPTAMEMRDTMSRNRLLYIESLWRSFLTMMSGARLLRQPLYTAVDHGVGHSDLHHSDAMLSLRHAQLPSEEVPSHLRTDLAFYKWSARWEESEMYAEAFADENTRIDLAPLSLVPLPRSSRRKTSFAFVMPWLQLGGSEKAMLDLAEALLARSYSVTFILTMPDWREDPLGEIHAENLWLPRALALTADVFDLVSLVPHHRASRVLRYLLESRRPDYVLLSNTRWAYAHLPLVRAVLPNAVTADYNHMIHTDWLGGGLPRYGANNSRYFDVHFTASKDVATPMQKWIGNSIMDKRPTKVRPCYIGTDPSLFYSGENRTEVRQNLRKKHDISWKKVVVLFAGRFIPDKGVDVLVHVAKEFAGNPWLQSKIHFMFVGEGPERPRLEKAAHNKSINVAVARPARSLAEMRDFYAMSDILVLPSVNEGIALVLYEAMASGLLVVTTDVGGQSELVSPGTGVLIPNSRYVSEMVKHVRRVLTDVLAKPEKYEEYRLAGKQKVHRDFTTEKFSRCIQRGLYDARRWHRRSKPTSATVINSLAYSLVPDVRAERADGMGLRQRVMRHLDLALTIGIKTYVCDTQTVEQVRALMRSIRINYPRVQVLLGNDGPRRLNEEAFIIVDEFVEEVVLPRDSGISVGRNTMVNLTTTKYFALLDDDHQLDDTTNFARAVSSLERGGFQLVGLRVRNLPGIEELEHSGISIPRYVSTIVKLEKRELLLCTWDENSGPGVYGMVEAYPVDVVHNAFVAKTDALRQHSWRNELQVNEHMTFFVDGWRNKLRVGYLPSEFVHHRARSYSKCYYNTRFREESFAKMTEYDEPLYYDVNCGRNFPRKVKAFIKKTSPPAFKGD